MIEIPERGEIKMTGSIPCVAKILVRYGSFDTREMMEGPGSDRLLCAIKDFNNIEQKIRITGTYAYYDHNTRRLNVVIDRIERQCGVCAIGSPDDVEMFKRATEKNLRTLLAMRYDKSGIKISSAYDINET